MENTILTDKSIAFVESLLDEELTLLTEKLVEQRAINATPPANKKSPWMASVVDEAYHYHTSITLQGEKIKSYECNCNTYRSGHLCAHITASIVEIRRQLNDIVAAASAPKSRSRSANPFNRVLSSLSKEELLQLVKDSARRDQTFKLMVQGRYYLSLSPEERTHIIEKAFPAMTRVDQKIGQRYISSFTAFCEEVLVIYEQLLREEDYVLAYEILFPILKKSFYIKTHLTKENNRLLNNHQLLINRFLEMTILIEAPALRISLNDQLIELLRSSYISANTPEEQKIWLYCSMWSDCREALRDILDSQIAKGKGEDLDSYYFFYMLSLLMTDESVRAEKIGELDSQTMYRIIQLLLASSEVSGVGALLREIIIHADINQVLLQQVLPVLGDDMLDAALTDRLLSIYMRRRNPMILTWLKEHSPDEDGLSDRIKELVESSGTQETMIDYYLLTDQMAKALETIESNLSLSLLQQYDHQLYPQESSALLSMYKIVCGEYIQDHFGSSSRDYLIDIYQHLKVIGAEDILKKLQTFIKAEFKNRRSLKVE